MGRPINELPSIKLMYDRNKRATASNAKNPRLGLIQIVVSYRGKKKTLSTGVSVYTDEWKNGTIVRRSDALDLQEQIATALHRVSSRVNSICNDESFNLNMIDAENGNNTISFLDWCRDEIELMDLKSATKATYYSTIESLSRFGRFIRFSDVTEKNILDFYKWRKNRSYSYNGTVISDNTLKVYHQKFKKLVSTAIKKGLIKNNPFANIDVSSCESKEIKFLSEDDISLLERIKPKRSVYKTAIDLFLVQCGSGLSFCDLLNFSKDKVEIKDNADGRYYVYREKRVKTNVDFYTILLPFAVNALERMNWHIEKINIQSYDDYLNKIGEMIFGFPLSSHVGRHTFATMALSNRIRMEVVQKMLGHKKISTTEIYAKLVDKSIEDEMAGLATIKPSTLHSADGPKP